MLCMRVYAYSGTPPALYVVSLRAYSEYKKKRTNITGQWAHFYKKLED